MTPLAMYRGRKDVCDFIAEHGIDPKDVPVDDCRIEDGYLVVRVLHRDRNGHWHLEPGTDRIARSPEQRVKLLRPFQPDLTPKPGHGLYG